MARQYPRSQQVELVTMNRRRLGPEANERLMSAVNILVGQVFALLVFLAVYVRRKLKPQFPALGSQRMCPNCGGITSRFQSSLPGVWQGADRPSRARRAGAANLTGGRHPGQRSS
jgi:hypothetical protein